MNTNKKEVRATANESKRTFTLRTVFNGNGMSKYRTNKMSKEDFENSKYNTNSDWIDFLKNSFDYYVI